METDSDVAGNNGEIKSSKDFAWVDKQPTLPIIAKVHQVVFLFFCANADLFQ